MVSIIIVLAWEFAKLGMDLLFFFYKLLLLLLSKVVYIWRLTQDLSETKQKRLIIIGGGFAGAYAAKKLEDYFQLTLIDTKDYFEFTPSVLRTIVEPNHISKIQILHHSYLDLKKTVILQHKAILITHDNNVLLDNNEKIPFDYLILASGSSYSEPFKESNVVMASRGSTLSKSYQKLVQSESILVIGGGIVGVELAAELVEHFPKKRIKLVHAGPHLLNRSSTTPFSVNYAHKFLLGKNVDIILNERIVQQHGNKFVTDQGKAIYADMAFLCTGNKNNLALLKANHSDCIDEEGFAIVNEYLQLKDNPHIFVAGDIMNIKEEKLAQNAEAAASTVVKNLLKYAKGLSSSSLHKYRPFTRPKLISLGKYDGVFVYKWLSFGGFLPSLMKEFVERKVMTAYRFRSGKLFK